ncbi:NADH-ubiquinone oxidoreductase-F iron-sulfur binding region domain-containing protein [Kitasatospora sp. NPDC101157]|uniref:NADH-ubiquinone oxidoreductase-F iron-sulfur binding region domain-containing protein n=1 Tax=Kitasatospora sp. NPDC101157 TaxID=3364098 RepID=UPI0037F9D695
MSAALDLPQVHRLGPALLTAGLDHRRRLDLAAHTDVHGRLPHLDRDALMAVADRIELRGRGGAGFPFARKTRATLAAADRTGTPPVVVVNGAEGEPPSAKDRMLLSRAPHLVIDGARLAAAALGAEELVIGVAAGGPGEVSIPAALAERTDLPCPARTVCLPERFVSGESGALIRGINGQPVLPPTVKARAADGGDGGVRRRPTLLANAETWAQLAVAARIGPDAYASVGIHEPGTVLLTVNRTGADQLVVEVPAGIRLGTVLEACGVAPGAGVLVGGYHGAWLDPRRAVEAPLSNAGLAAVGGTLGAGAIAVLPAEVCPLGEIARIAAWLAAESAGQCGPCKRGLPAAADALAALAAAGGGSAALDALETARRAVTTTQGGGACSHPDGTARFVLSALDVFAEDVALHTSGAGCGRPVNGALPLPRRNETTLEVDWSRCAGHGLCAVLAPDLIRLGPHGYPVSTVMAVAAWQEHGARRAVNQCPALALRIRRRG